MDFITKFILIGWVLLGLIPLFGLRAKRGKARWGFGILLGLWAVILIPLIVVERAWVRPDDEVDGYYRAALIKAIEQGREEVPLGELTNFEWSAVCWIYNDPYANEYQYQYDDQGEISKSALGRDVHGWLATQEGEEVLVFKTPGGLKMIRPHRWQSTETTIRLKGRIYATNIQVEETGPRAVAWPHLCYLPGRLKVAVRPESN